MRDHEVVGVSPVYNIHWASPLEINGNKRGILLFRASPGQKADRLFGSERRPLLGTINRLTSKYNGHIIGHRFN